MFQKHSFQVGFSFGITSAIITTLGLMVGLGSSTNSKLVVIGGVLTIAIADAFSDALGIHISEESEKTHTSREVWESTIFTFLAKFIFASIFVIPLLFLDLYPAIWTNIAIGATLLCILSYVISEGSFRERLRVIGEHLFIGFIVIMLSNFVGKIILKYFN